MSIDETEKKGAAVSCWSEYFQYYGCQNKLYNHEKQKEALGPNHHLTAPPPMSQLLNISLTLSLPSECHGVIGDVLSLCLQVPV